MNPERTADESTRKRPRDDVDDGAAAAADDSFVENEFAEYYEQMIRQREIRNQIYEDDPELIRLLKTTTRENLSDERFQTIREAVDAAEQAGLLNEQNSTGDTALTIACANDLPTAVEYLLNHGANPHVINNTNETPLELAFNCMEFVVNDPMPINLVERLEVPEAMENKRCVLWIATHGICSAITSGEHNDAHPPFFHVPAGMTITRYSVPRGYDFFFPDQNNDGENYERSMFQAIQNGIDETDAHFDATGIQEVMGDRFAKLEEDSKKIRKFSDILTNQLTDPTLTKAEQKFLEKNLKELHRRQGQSAVVGENVRQWFSSPTVFGENDTMYNKLLSSDLPKVIGRDGQFDETHFYRHRTEPANRELIMDNFVVRFCFYPTMFVLEFKILFPFDHFNEPQYIPLSTILEDLKADGFTDITIIDHSCSGYQNINYGTPQWDAENEEFQKQRECFPGKKCGGSNGKRHRSTRKRRGWVRRRQTLRTRRSRRRQRRHHSLRRRRRNRTRIRQNHNISHTP
jgi:hypothetical protein